MRHVTALRLFGALGLFAWPGFTAAEWECIESQSENTPTRYRLTADPAAEPNPPLRYELMPNVWERKPGNAAAFYLRAHLLQAQLSKDLSKDYHENYKTWMQGRLDAPTKEAMRKWLSAHVQVWRELRTAVYRETCSLDYRVRDIQGLQAISFLLPDAESTRELARALRIRARLDIAEGRVEDAVETVRTALQLAHDVAAEQLLINGLVGIACAEVTCDSVSELIAAPRSPNLYWAIASLPRPLIDATRGLQFERGLSEQIFPVLKDAETAERTPDQWRHLVQNMARDASWLEDSSAIGLTEVGANLATTVALLKAYPEAKRRLVAAGFDPPRVEAMPVAQVVAIQTARVTKYAYQELLKWTTLPYPQAVAGMEASQKKLETEKILTFDMSFTQGALPVAAMLMPALPAVAHAQARLDRHLAALQLIEALRWHAAVNGGRLPATLDEVSVVPVPLNPATGKAFVYRLENGVGLLELTRLPGSKPETRYEIVIRQTGQKGQKDR